MVIEQKIAFVTGGTGKIGYLLVKRLVFLGFFVKVLTRKQENPWPDINNVEIIKGDIRNKEIIKYAICGCDYIFHLAVYQNIDDMNKVLFNEINVEGTRIILDSAINAGIKKIVYVSTASIFKSTGKIERNEEWHQKIYSPYDFYIQTKIDALELVRRAKKDLPIVVVYPSAVIDLKNLLTSVTLKSFSFQRFLWEKIGGGIPGGIMNLIGAKGRIFNYVVVEDLVEGIILAAIAGRSGEEYILGGENITTGEYLSSIAKILNKRVFPFRIPIFLFKAFLAIGLFIPLPPIVKLIAKNPPTDLYISSAKAQKELGYDPKLKIKQKN